MIQRRDDNYPDSGPRGGGLVLVGCGCGPLGLLLSLVISALGTLLANLFLRRRP